VQVVEEDCGWLSQETECDPEEIVAQLGKGGARHLGVDGARHGNKRNLRGGCVVRVSPNPV